MKHNGELSDHFLLEEMRKRLNEKNRLLQIQTNLVVQLEELNGRLRDVERVKSAFLSNIRNEINNPLTAILGFSGQMMQGLAMDANKIKQFSSLINKEAFSLDFQLRNIFSAAEIEAGEIAPLPALVNIDDLIQNQIQYFKQRALKHNITVDYLSRKSGHFKTDGGMLQAIVMNLLSNAIEFSPKNNEVEIACEFDAGKLVLTVRDYGRGIEPKDQKHIFDRFKQLESGTTKAHQGHGLGLSIAKEFVEALRGEISIDSQPNNYTNIIVTLPEFVAEGGPEGFSTDGEEMLFSDEQVL